MLCYVRSCPILISYTLIGHTAIPGVGPLDSTPRGNRAAPPSFRERYAVLLDVARILTGTLRPEELYGKVYEQTSRVLETTGFSISLYDAAADTASVVFYADHGKIERVDVSYRGSESTPIREARPLIGPAGGTEVATLLPRHAKAGPTRSSLSAPMVRKDKVLGVITVQSHRVNAYGRDDLELLVAVADQAAVVLENVQQVTEIERRRREAERLEEIGRAVSASLELPRTLERVAVAALDLTEADAATVWLLRGEAEVEVAMAGGNSAVQVGAVVAIPPTLYSRIVERRESVVFDDVQSHPLLSAEMRSLLRTRSALAAPLVAEDRVIGVLSAGHVEPRRYRTEDMRLLERLAYQAAIAVENARLHEQIRTLSLTDPLTGLPNRRHLEIVLEKEFAAARRGRPLTVVLFDLDHFKHYNDAVGHPAGDEALKTFARVLAQETRAMNLAARYGGDEFICVLADADQQGGLTHTARVVEAITCHPILGDIGVSAGIASFHPDMIGPDQLIHAADRDLYRRKSERDAPGVPGVPAS